MKAVFADTVYFLAMLNPDDQLHDQARTLALTVSASLLTTEFVLMEVGDALSRGENRQRFKRLVELLRAQLDVEIVAAAVPLKPLGSDRGVWHLESGEARSREGGRRRYLLPPILYRSLFVVAEGKTISN